MFRKVNPLAFSHVLAVQEPSGGGASHQQHPSTAGGTPVRANPRLFQRAMAAHAQPEEPRGEGRGRL